MTHHGIPVVPTMQYILLTIALTLVVLYIVAATTNKSRKKWPLVRTISFTFGIFLATIAVIGPLANAAHTHFQLHMVGHLLLGMLAPLLIVFAAPMTLLLRTLPTKPARIITKFLKSPLPEFITDPITTTILNIGGLYILYTSGLYAYMHTSSDYYMLVHAHILWAGYLFTASILYIDPVFHRKSYRYRGIALFAAIASHSILAKYLYAHPPSSVPVEQAEIGSMLMYYGGGIVDGALVFLLCMHWYRATKPENTKRNTSDVLLK